MLEAPLRAILLEPASSRTQFPARKARRTKVIQLSGSRTRERSSGSLRASRERLGARAPKAWTGSIARPALFDGGEPLANPDPDRARRARDASRAEPLHGLERGPVALPGPGRGTSGLPDPRGPVRTPPRPTRAVRVPALASPRSPEGPTAQNSHLEVDSGPRIDHRRHPSRARAARRGPAYRARRHRTIAVARAGSVRVPRLH